MYTTINVVVSMNVLGLEEVCKGDKKHLHSFTILTSSQDSLLPQVQKTELQTRRQNGKRVRKKQSPANAPINF